MTWKLKQIAAKLNQVDSRIWCWAAPIYVTAVAIFILALALGR